MDQSTLLSLFVYKDGKLFHKNKLKNNSKPGMPVGTLDKDGYLKTLIKRKPYRVHRIIFMMHHGYIPKILDHIDGDVTNNRIENLREVTVSESNRNRGKHRNNTSGFKGVTFVKSIRKYSSRICINNKRLFLGYFDDPETAYVSYCDAAKKFGNGFVRL